MGGVQFDEQASYQTPVHAQGGLVGFLIKSGLAKDAASAQGMLLALAVCCIIGAIFVFVSAQKAIRVIPAPPPAGFTE